MSLDNYLRIAAENGLNGFTIWRTREGTWQANSRYDGSDGFTVITGGEVIHASKTALVGGKRGNFPDWTGFGEDGPVGIEFKKLIEAIGRNWRARQALEAAATAPEEEDDEL